MTKSIKSIPKLEDVLFALKEDIFSSFNCHAVGKIESFNKDTQRAKISIMYSRKVESDSDTQNRVDYPLMADIPVIIPSGGVGSLRFPISSGDFCLVLFNDRDIDNFIEAGAFSQLNSDRKHSFSDGVAIVGLFPSSFSLSDYSDEKTELVHDETKISLGDKIKVKNSVTSLYLVMNDMMTILNTISAAVAVSPGNPSFPGLTAVVTATKAKLDSLMEQS